MLLIIYCAKPMFYYSPQCYHCLFSNESVFISFKKAQTTSFVSKWALWIFPGFYFEEVRAMDCIHSCSEMSITFGYPFVTENDQSNQTSLVKMYFKGSIHVKQSNYSYRLDFFKFLNLRIMSSLESVLGLTIIIKILNLLYAHLYHL